MAKQKVLITVKTYPTLSQKYTELVCTAGINEDGSWIRIYPSPFRFLEQDKQYKKYQWIELDLEKNPNDLRPESYRPINIDDIKLGDFVSPNNNWQARKDIIFSKNPVYTNMDTVIAGAKSNNYSLVIFKPTEIVDFIIEKVSDDWEITRKQAIEESLKQGSLFSESSNDGFKLIPKLPYKFSYKLKDDTGKVRQMMIEDWEIGALYWNCVKDYGKDKATQKVKEKYFDEFVNKCDLHLFLGTSKEWHFKNAPNPYMVIGAFYPRIDKQESLF